MLKLKPGTRLTPLTPVAASPESPPTQIQLPMGGGKQKRKKSRITDWVSDGPFPDARLAGPVDHQLLLEKGKKGKKEREGKSKYRLRPETGDSGRKRTRSDITLGTARHRVPYMLLHIGPEGKGSGGKKKGGKGVPACKQQGHDVSLAKRKEEEARDQTCRNDIATPFPKRT